MRDNLQHKNSFLQVNKELENLNYHIKKYDEYEFEINKN
jgi:hypothetical protein